MLHALRRGAVRMGGAHDHHVLRHHRRRMDTDIAPVQVDLLIVADGEV
jgi:hypothetical protein